MRVRSYALLPTIAGHLINGRVSAGQAEIRRSATWVLSLVVDNLSELSNGKLTTARRHFFVPQP